MALTLAGIAAVGFGLYQALTRSILRGIGPLQSVFLQAVIGSVLGALAVVCAGHVPTSADALLWGTLWFSVAGLLNWGAGIALLSVSQQRIGAVATAPLTATTPLFGIFVAIPALGELPTVVALSGTAVMILGVIVGCTTLPRRRGSPRIAASHIDPWAGLGTALCWALAAIFVRKGSAHTDPLFGIWVSMLAVAVVYALVFGVSRAHAWRPVPRRLLVLEIGATALVGTATWTFWVAIERADSVGLVLALSLLQVPTAMLAAPLVAGRSGETWTSRGFVSAALVGAGALLIVAFK
jgi:drug/metabolite transporter (DMT)-like permease